MRPTATRRILHLLLPAAVVLLAAGARAEHAGPGEAARIPEYFEALRILWREVYAGGGRTLYCERSFGRHVDRRVNVEHVFPMSWVAWHLQCGSRARCRRESERFNRIEADLHNLWPARREVNEARGSHPFGLVAGERHAFRGCDFEVDERARLVEPRPGARGEIARSMFYMATEYGLEIRERLGRTLQRWNREDPVSEEERRRNDVIERIQGNRNPYVDDPQLAGRLRF